MENAHKPVLLKEAVDGLQIKPAGVYVDATFGEGGHARKILEKISGEGMLIGIDADGTAIEKGAVSFSGHSNLKLFHANFRDIWKIIEKAGVTAVAGILFDFGVSSRQLDEQQRGFSFLRDGPLDMRMDGTSGLTARQVVNGYPEDELAEIFKKYGEERHAGRIAKSIALYRKQKPVKTTFELAGIVSRAVPRTRPQGGRHEPGRCSIHPATRVFQALRIEVNGELESIESVLCARGARGARGAQSAPGAIWKRMEKGGRVVAISFHSLEDRIVKNAFRDAASGGLCEVLTKKPVVPGENELEANPRARSAKMRIAAAS